MIQSVSNSNVLVNSADNGRCLACNKQHRANQLFVPEIEVLEKEIGRKVFKDEMMGNGFCRRHVVEAVKGKWENAGCRAPRYPVDFSEVDRGGVRVVAALPGARRQNYYTLTATLEEMEIRACKANTPPRPKLSRPVALPSVASARPGTCVSPLPGYDDTLVELYAEISIATCLAFSELTTGLTVTGEPVDAIDGYREEIGEEVNRCYWLLDGASDPVPSAS